MSDYPRWLELEVAEVEGLPPPPPEEENPMSETRKCSQCSGPIGNANKSGICTPCQKPNRYSGQRPGGASSKPASLPPARASTLPDDDDAVLERIAVKPPPPAKVRKTKAPPPPAGDVEEFFTLAAALGLEPQDMLDTWCREWVHKTRNRALADSDPAAELAAAIELVERAAATKPEATGD